ncbi:c-type cytochrome biogenesis protein CcmF [Geoglobus ahangari]|uniref:C-type cytochrome biogenesis protein CcmF n=1 Tax=Geoglobus ahangari TaxID=113653 RepID=A0A0F7IC14_9EURY|nr:cytochrome c biogenesis protein CcsA [Geoglobus ahangari]AKG90752.1 c-type cytochrome biogenesis protein CcmF [Geoglobus ahangari]
MDIGYLLAVLAFVASVYSAYSFYGSITSKGKRARRLALNGERTVYAYTVLVALAYLLLTYYFIVRDFNVKYVYSYSDTHLNLAYTISAVWAGREGSLLLWILFLSILNVLFLKVEKKDRLSAMTLAISSGVASFFLLVLLTFSNPFYRWEYFPHEGYGLNPLLRTPEMALHPPTVFLGYAGATLPFALAIASAYLKSEGWHLRARLWALISWLFLTIGIFLGAWWAYKTLGWGGFWAWDPVENASLLPWLTVTGLLHGIMRQRQFSRWNYWLAYVSFALVVLATFITRSGVIESVHAFGENPEGWLYLILIAAAGLLALYVYSKRKDFFSEEGYELLSRDFAVFLNILLLILSTVTVLIGTLTPSVFEGVSIDRAYYDRVETPLAAILTLLLGICISLGWVYSPERTKRILIVATPVGLASLAATYLVLGMPLVALAAGIAAFSITSHLMTFKPADARNPRKLGGYLVHIGVLLISVGVAGSWMYDEVYQNVHLGIHDESAVIHSKHFGDIRLELVSLDQVSTPESVDIVARIDIYENGVYKGTVTPTTKFYNLMREDRVVNGVDILSTPFKDYYVAMSGFSQNQIFLEVHLIPLIFLVWIGSAMMIVGGFVSAAVRMRNN